jgi:hypothetical protein
MFAYLLRRIAIIIPTLVFVSMIIFGLQQLLPGDPALAMAGEERDPQVIAFLRAKYHLDQPLPVRYGLWVEAVVHGDLGESIRINRPVLDLVIEKLPVTAELAGLAMCFAVLIGIPAGVLSVVKERLDLGLRGQRLRAVGPLDAEFLAGIPHANGVHANGGLENRNGNDGTIARFGWKAQNKRATDILGRELLTAYAPVASLGWLVFVELPIEEINVLAQRRCENTNDRKSCGSDACNSPARAMAGLGQKPPPSFAVGAAGAPQKPDAPAGGRHLRCGPIAEILPFRARVVVRP